MTIYRDSSRSNSKASSSTPRARLDTAKQFQVKSGWAFGI